MGRFLTKRIVVEGELVVLGALHVGGSETELFADMMLARNGRGEIYLPATSLVGPMRAWWERAFDILPKYNDVWGPARQGESDKGQASLIRVEDASLIEESHSEIRDHVGIDRYTGTAAEGIKYDREILPEGSRFALRFVIEIPRSDDISEVDLRQKLGALLFALEQGEIRFGGGKTRGLGRARLEKGRALTEDLKDRRAFLDALLSPQKPDAKHFEDLVAQRDKDVMAPALMNIEISWKSELPVMVKDGRQGFIVDMIPLTTGKGDEVCTVLPGAGLKGAIRFHSERVVRTLQGSSGVSCAENGDFAEQMVPHEIIKRLFGAKGERENPRENKARFGMGAVFVEDCFPDTSPVKRTTIKNLLTTSAEDSEKLGKVKEIISNGDEGAREYCPVQHVAIDRWTGGAADGALYSVLEPSEATGTIRIGIDLSRIKGDEKQRWAALALLLVVLRDFKSGMLPVGFGGNRGLGAIKVERINVATPALAGWPRMNGELDELELSDLSSAWEEFVKSLGKAEEKL